MRTLKLVIAYDGSRFVGWQRQAHGESIQGLLEDALARFEGAPVSVHGSGRTDAGVHALGQVASTRVTFAHEGATLMRALNAQLPADVRILAVEDAPPDFHARFSARSKTYRYHIRNAPLAMPFERGYVWHLPERLALGDMNRAAAALVGTHDFSAFRSGAEDGRRGAAASRAGAAGSRRTIIRAEWSAIEGSRVERWSGPATAITACQGMLLSFEITGDGFLRHMVRAIVGTLVEVGRGWRSIDDFTALLVARDRGEAGATAPSHGLFLVGVDYD